MSQLSEGELLDRGYRKSLPKSHLHDRYDALFQRRFRDGEGTRYFVNVRFWRHSKFGDYPDGWDAFVQLTDPDGKVFRVTLLDTRTVDEVEAFFEGVWVSLRCQHYEKD